MSVEIWVAIITVIGGLGVAAVGKFGRRDETRTAAADSLINGQSKRIDSLENRLDTVEADLQTTRADLQSTRTELHKIQSHAGDLRDALRSALNWIAEVLEHFKAPEHIAPPAAPNIERWQALIDSPPKARNPPGT